MNKSSTVGAAIGRKTYHCGTLTYTKAGLLALFACLLWGDFCYTVMEAVMVATYFMAVFVDRWHPLRIGVYAAVFGVIANMMSWMWIFVTLPGNCFFWLALGGTLITALLSAITGVAALPCEMRIFPQSRFGQSLLELSFRRPARKT